MEDITVRSILIADDMALVREGISRLCEAEGRFRVAHQTGEGTSALEWILAYQPDLAILDFNLPRLFSLELVRKLRAQQSPTKILILSTRGDRKLVLEALRGGASGFVLKSSEWRHLHEALDQICAGGVYVSPELELEKIFITSRGQESGDPLETLSSREYQVFSLLIDGIRAKEIAARLDLSPKTVDTYRASLMRKLDIYNVASLVKFAIQREITTSA